MNRFPADPTHNMIFELKHGILFQFDAGVNAWVELSSNSKSLPIATPIKAGTMSSIDLRKLNDLILPSPVSTITGNDCISPFKSGPIGLRGDNHFISVNGDVDIRNVDGFGDIVNESFPFQIHKNTYGFDFNLDIPKLVQELKDREQFKIYGKTGDEGSKGEMGDPGIDGVISGFQGEKGDEGDAPVRNLSIEPEPVLSQIRPGLKKALSGVKVVDDPNDSDKFMLEFTRQDIGINDHAARRFNVRNQKSTWLLSVVSISGTPQQVYYLDIEPIISAVHSKFVKEVELLKNGYDDIVKFWVQTMSDLFDEQKNAICCALESCMSKTKSNQARQHIENVAASALPHAKIKINNRGSTETKEIDSAGLLDDEVCGESEGKIPPSPPPPPPTPEGEIDVDNLNPIECSPGLDIVFNIDTTGSMGPTIDEVKSSVDSMVDIIEEVSGGDYRIALIEFKDDVNTIVPFSNKNREEFKKVINTLKATGGGAFPEAGSEAIIRGTSLPWRPSPIARIGIHFTDATTNPPSMAHAAATAGSFGITYLAVQSGSSTKTKEELKTLSKTTDGIYSNLTGSVDELIKLTCGAIKEEEDGEVFKASISQEIKPFKVITLDPLMHSGIANSNSIELPAGRYSAIISKLNVQINNMHYAPLAIQYTNDDRIKISKFLDKGEFTSLLEAKNAYEGLTMAFEHQGGLVNVYYNIFPTANASGDISISLSTNNLYKSTITQSVEEQEQSEEQEQFEEPKQVVQKLIEQSCFMTAEKLRWYERGWQLNKGCGCVINVSGQDYIIIKRSIGDDQSCGGGEHETEPCIAQFLKEYGHPAIAWPTFDGNSFASIPEAGINFRYDQKINNYVSDILNNEQYSNPKGNPNGFRHLTYQLELILFPEG